MNQENQARPPRLSPVAQFWRDVSVQAVAGVIVALFLYVGAILLGYLALPGVGELVLFAVALLTPGAIFSILVSRRIDGKKTHRIISFALVVVAIVAFAYGVAMLAQHPPADDFMNPFPL